MYLSLSCQKCEVDLLLILLCVTGYECVLKSDDVSIEFESMGTDLFIILVDDVFCDEEYSHIHFLLYLIVDQFYLFDRLWCKLINESFIDDHVLLKFKYSNFLERLLIRQPAWVRGMIMHWVKSICWQLFCLWCVHRFESKFIFKV